MAIILEEEEFERIIPFVTWVLIAVNIAIFVYEMHNPWVIYRFGFVPKEFLEGHHIETLLTSLFIHTGILHLVINMYFLFVFCDDLENVYGHGFFVIFYIVCGVGALLFHTLVVPDYMVDSPVVGASGALCGAVAAYAIYFPKRKLTIISFFYCKIEARDFALFYLILETILVSIQYIDYVAHTAHIGGFIIGSILGYLYKKIVKPRIYRTPQKPW